MGKLSALEKYRVILPILDSESSAVEIGKEYGIPVRTIHSWLKQFSLFGLNGLERKTRSDKGLHRSISKEMLELVQGLALQKPPLLIKSIYRKIKILAKRKCIEAPSYDTIYKIVKGIDPGLKTLAIEGSKAYQQKYELLYRRECKRSNEIWQADHTELDIYIIDDKGIERKPWLTTIIDDYSRAISGKYLSFEPPSSINTALALRHAIWKKKNTDWEICGVPSILYTDHGADFKSIHIEQVCINLKIRMINSAVGKPRGRGKVERFFQTINECFLCDQPGFTINGKPISKPAHTLISLDELLDNFIVNKYHKDIHSKTGESPTKRWSSDFLPVLPDSIDQLDDLLLTINKSRKVLRDGIRFNGMRYISTTLAGFVNELVTIKYDPRDIAEIRVYHDGKFLCKAICQDLANLTIGLKEIKKARLAIKKGLHKKVKSFSQILKENLQEKSISKTKNEIGLSSQNTIIKLYEND